MMRVAHEVGFCKTPSWEVRMGPAEAWGAGLAAAPGRRGDPWRSKIESPC